MKTLVAFALALAALGFRLYVLLRERRVRARVWRATARSLGLTGVTGEGSSKALEGFRGTRSIRFERIEPRDEPYGTRVTVGGDSGITLQREDWATALGKSLGKAETEIGDPDFDREIYARGEPAILRAVLDAETRGAVRKLVMGSTFAGKYVRRGSMEVVAGDIVAELSDRGFGTPELFTEAVETLLGLARRLDRPADLAGRIAENTFAEPDSAARLANVVLLASRYPDHAASREAFKHACRDGNVEVRLRAAVALGGEEGRDTLLQIASSQASNESLAARAVAGLGRRLPLDRGLEMLGDALRRRHVETARACLESLGQVGGDAVAAPLAKVLAVEAGPLAVAAAQALGESGSAAAEAPLLEALAQAASDVGAAAAEALGRVGSAGAVLPLKEAAEAGAGAGLRRAARQAIAQIQFRLPGATPGQLSLAEGAAGQLSLADEDGKGRVSLAEPSQRR